MSLAGIMPAPIAFASWPAPEPIPGPAIHAHNALKG